MAINYFDQLGFGGLGQRTQQAALNQQGIRANEQNMRSNEQNMQMNQQNQQRQVAADQQAMVQFQDDKQKQRAAQGAGAFYNALQSGNDNAALQIANQYQEDINGIGDPTFTVNSVSELMKTPEGKEQLKQMSLGMVQLAGGPEQMARFTASQQPKPEASMTQYQQASTDLRQQELVIKRDESKLAAMLKAQQQEANDLKKQELGLKIQEQEQRIAQSKVETEQKKKDKVATIESSVVGIDSFMSTIDKILLTPLSTIESAAGPISARLPTISQETANFEELINTLDSQSFVAQVPLLKGLGALSNAEGQKISAALANFSLRQSPEQLLKNGQEVKSIMFFAKQKLINSLGEQQPQQPQQQPQASGRREQDIYSEYGL